MSTFVLIHGSMHGARCWDKVVPLLVSAGHEVVVPDLPAHGRDKTPRAGITLQSYVDKVIEAMEAQGEPVILVGHSMAGVILTQAAGQRPELINRLVYVTAHSISPGESISGNRPLAPDALITRYLYLDEKVGGFTIRRKHIKEVFYNLCSDEDIDWAARRLVPQPPRPFSDVLDVERDVVDAVPMN